MNTIRVDVTCYDKGDRVRTYEGIGTVMEDEPMILDEYDLYNRNVEVLLDVPTSRYQNRKGTFDAEHVSPLEK